MSFICLIIYHSNEKIQHAITLSAWSKGRGTVIMLSMFTYLVSVATCFRKLRTWFFFQIVLKFGPHQATHFETRVHVLEVLESAIKAFPKTHWRIYAIGYMEFVRLYHHMKRILYELMAPLSNYVYFAIFWFQFFLLVRISKSTFRCK